MGRDGKEIKGKIWEGMGWEEKGMEGKLNERDGMEWEIEGN